MKDEIEKLLEENRLLKTELEAARSSTELWLSAYQSQARKLKEAHDAIDEALNILEGKHRVENSL